MTQEQLILFKRSLNIYNTEIEAWTALDNLIHTQGQPVVAFFRRTSNTHGDTALGAIFAIGTANGVGKYKACSSHDDMLAVLQALNTHISEWTAFKDTFDKMFEYDANHKAIKAKLDFYTDSNKNISAGGLGGSGSSSLGALYQLIDVMINSTGDGVEGAAEGSVLAYDATAGKWKAIAQSEILPNMSDYYTKDETDAAINAIPIYSMSELSASEIANLSDGTNVREAYRLKKGGSNVDDTVIKIYKDSAIKSLELRDNKYLVLTYIDNEGNEQSISKDLSAIVNDNYVDLINNQEIGGIKTFTEKTIFKKDINVLGDGIFGGEVASIVGDGTPAGVTDYSALTGKPSINGKELTSGENTLTELGIQPAGNYITESLVDIKLDNYATKVFVSNNYASKGVVNAIQALIPATASADNQLADKDFVNSSIATATAEFRGSFTSLDELKSTSGNLNDYAFYLHTDSVSNSIVDRYKWTTAGWLYEYTLNNSSFTAEQWAALNSTITATLVNSYNSHLNNSTIHITSAERTAWNAKWDYNEETIKAVKVDAAVNADYASSAGNADTLDDLHAADFAKVKRYIIPGTDVNSIGYGITDNGNMYAGPMATFGTANYFIEIQSPYDKPELYYRLYNTNRYSDIKQFAFTDSNVASATKLATARKIWGRYFDGSDDVSGDLEYVGNITASGKAKIQGDIVCGGEVVAVAGEGTPAGVTDYSALTGKPSINGVTLVSGNNTLAALGIQAAGDYATNSGVTTLLSEYATKTFISNNYAGKAAFNSHAADTNIHITSAEREAWNAKWTYDEATIKAVKVTSASSADSVAWSGISDKPTTFTPSAHTHTASEISGLPTKLSAFTNDVGYITGITKPMVEGVLTGNITSHTHSYLPLSGGTMSNTNVITNLNADLLDGYQISEYNNKPYGTIPVLNKRGFMDVGKHFEFHYDNTTGSDYSTILACTGNYSNKVNLPSASGTLALLTDNVDSASKWATPRTITLTGSVTGSVSIDGSQNVSLATTTNHTHNYAGSSSAGGSANSALTLLYNNKFDTTYGSYAVFQQDAGRSDLPHTGWFNSIKMLHDNSSGYFTEIATSFTGEDGMWRRALQGGSQAGWYKMLDSGNYNSYSPTLTGAGASGTWGISISGNAATATNADTLDDLHAADFAKVKRYIIPGTDVNSIGYGITDNGNMYNGPMATFGTANYFIEIQSSYDKPELYYRLYNTNRYSDIKQFAFTDSNVASATKLQTPRTIWGQSFDGTSDVNGDAHITGDLIVDGEVSALVA